jgi:hypothetical protein
MPRPDQDSRSSGNGEYVRTVETAERDAAAARLRSRGRTYAQIAEELGLSGKQVAFDCVQRAIKAIVKEPATEALAIELERLDLDLIRLEELETEARTVMRRNHLTVSHGKVISTANPDTGKEEPLLDDGPVLQAIDRLVRIEEARGRNSDRRARLLGLNAPTRVDAIVHEVTQQDLELQELLREAKAKVAAQEQAIHGGTLDEG